MGESQQPLLILLDLPTKDKRKWFWDIGFSGTYNCPAFHETTPSELATIAVERHQRFNLNLTLWHNMLRAEKQKYMNLMEGVCGIIHRFNEMHLALLSC